MCGRFVLEEDDFAQVVDDGDTALANDLPDRPNYNICPTDRVAVITSQDGTRRARAMRWGFVPHWAKSPTDGPLLINARAESIAEKPAFRAAARGRRGIVPASGFYEWTKDTDGNRLPWYISARDGAPMRFGAVWQDWESRGERLTTCAIVTTAASADISAIHHRMPLILDPEDVPLWLGEDGHGASRLVRPAADGTLHVWRVGTTVNSNRASGASLIEPIGGTDGGSP